MIPGFTRNIVTHRYALLTPAGFVTAPLPGWSNAACIVLISPAMGAKFSQTLVTLAKQGRGTGRTDRDELFAVVLNGACTARVGRVAHKLPEGGYIFVPPKTSYEFSGAAEGTRLLLFEKTFVPLPGKRPPRPMVGRIQDQPSTPFLGDPDAQLQMLMPDTMDFDWAINVFTFQPGATLPFVETHIMEHGMMFLSGQGIYRLDADWHPVQAEDVLWIAPYCPQWFAALGKSSSSYIYYKDVNRGP